MIFEWMEIEVNTTQSTCLVGKKRKNGERSEKNVENSLGIKENIEVVGIPLVKITKIQSRFFSLCMDRKGKVNYIDGKQLYVQKFHFGPYDKNKTCFEPK